MKQGVYGCGVEVSLDVLGGKWKTVILAQLKQGPMRYADLRRALPRLSDKVLTERLRELETSELIVRSPRASGGGYALSARGESLRPVLDALYAWGEVHALELGATIRR